MPVTSNKKAPPKLSPQEFRVATLLNKQRRVDVSGLYRIAKELGSKTLLPEHRKQQQHVGVIVARINKKRRKFVIVPGGDRTYKLTRRR